MIYDILLEYTHAEDARYFEEMSGWAKFQPVLSEVTSYKECLKRLHYELANKRRPMIAKRIVQKYNTLKAKELEEQVNDFFNKHSDSESYSTEQERDNDRELSLQSDIS